MNIKSSGILDDSKSEVIIKLNKNNYAEVRANIELTPKTYKSVVNKYKNLFTEGKVLLNIDAKSINYFQS